MNDDTSARTAMQAQHEAEVETLTMVRLDDRKTDPCPPNPQVMTQRQLLEELVASSRSQQQQLKALDGRMGLLELRFGTDERQGLQAWKRLDEYAGRIERVMTELELVRKSQQNLGTRQAMLQAEHDEMASKVHGNVIPLKAASEAE